MSKNFKKFLTKSIFVLFLIHLAYFVYGYFKFVGIKNVNIYSEFYRFKFYDDVSISHFFVSSLFLFIFLILILKNYSKEKFSTLTIFKIAIALLLIAFLSLTFFISCSFGLNAKLKTELSETNFNKDKILLNVLNPFLYPYTSYSSEKLFNVKNILYPKPYPIIGVNDTVFYEPNNKENFSVKENYYSIDTLKMLTSNYDKIKSKSDSILDIIGFDKEELNQRIIFKKIIKDSTKIIYRGREVSPEYDADICVFIKNKSFFSPIQGVLIEKQQYENAVKRYKLLYKYNTDSLLYSFQKLDTLFKKYQIESWIKPKDLTKDAFYYRDNNQEPLNRIRNSFDRNNLIEKFNILNKLFYQPNYLHLSIRKIFFTVIFVVWFILFLLFILWNYKNKKYLKKE